MQFRLLLEEFDHNKSIWKTPFCTVAAKKIPVPSFGHPLLYACWCLHTTPRHTFRGICASEELVGIQKAGFAVSSVRPHWLERIPPQQDSSTRTHVPADTRSRFRVLTSVTHFCQDYSTESCISIHSTGGKIQILDRFPSSSPLFPQWEPSKTTRAKHSDWPVWSQLLQHPSRDTVCDIVDGESKLNATA